MGARRLPAPLHPGVTAGRTIRFSVDGRAVDGMEGEPIAAALLAAGRPVLSRSFRFHRPRGLMCSTGQCGWCECRVDGVPSVRSCRAAVREGIVVEGEHAWPSVRRDMLEALGLGARWIPPTFYHHRFLRPRTVRKRYLEVLRAFGGRGRLVPGGHPPSGRPAQRRSVDVAVVGGGPAGLTAALAAREAGASVLLLEAGPATGGSWQWREESLPGGGSVSELVRRVDESGVDVRTDAVVMALDEDRLHAVTRDALLEVRAAATVLAIGSYERLPVVPGNDRPGVMGARTVEWLIRALGILPGERAALVGAGPDIGRASAALRAAGARVVVTLEADALRSIEGRTGVGAVRVRRADGDMRVGCDLVVVGDRSPAIDLTLAAGIDVRFDDPLGLVPLVDDAGRTNVPGLLVVGAAAGHRIETEDAVHRAEATGRAAAAGVPEEESRPTAAWSRPATSVRADHSPSAADRAMVCFCEDVSVADLAAERAAGYADPELLKRRSGALTGPCQGKYCATAFCAVIGTSDARPDADGRLELPTGRPPARPVRLGDLVVDPGHVPFGDAR